MRRKDRAMTKKRAWQIVDEAPFAVLSMNCPETGPYGLAISPVRLGENIYIHGAPQGKKIDCLSANARVSMVFVGKVRVPSAISPETYREYQEKGHLPKLMSSKFTTEYESAIIRGKAIPVEEDKEKREVLRAISQRYTPGNMAYADQAIDMSLKRTAVFRIELEEISGKEKVLDPSLR